MGRLRSTRALRHAHLERLMHYYHFIGERIAQQAANTVSSAQLASVLNMDDTQVRKDLAAIGVRGYPRVGFKTTEVMEAIREVLGFDASYKAVLIGAGRLGGAMAAYRGFSRYGLSIVALFDANLEVLGSTVGGYVVQPLHVLEAVIQRHGVRLGILTVPAEAAQPLTDRLVGLGVRAIWNFAPTGLTVPEWVVLRHEHISVGLAELAYFLKNSPEGAPAALESGAVPR